LGKIILLERILITRVLAHYIMVHELGHALGFEDDTLTVLKSNVDKSDERWSEFSVSDLDEILRIFPDTDTREPI